MLLRKGLGIPISAVVCHVDNGRVLAVSRKSNPNDWGLPGGKWKPGELLLDTARRELLEEVGITATLHYWGTFPYISRKDGSLVWVPAYRTSEIFGVPTQQEEGVEVAWKTPEELCDDRMTFAAYNRRLFQTMGLITWVD